VLVDGANAALSRARAAHADDITRLAFRRACPGDPLLASGADDGAVKLWAPRAARRAPGGPLDGRLLGAPWAAVATLGAREHRGRLCALAFSEGNGRLLVAADASGGVHLWAAAGRGWARAHVLREDGWPVPSLALGAAPLSVHHRQAMEVLYPPLAAVPGADEQRGGWGGEAFAEARVLAEAADAMEAEAGALAGAAGAAEALKSGAEARAADGGFERDGAQALPPPVPTVAPTHVPTVHSPC
jgi:hypothetical protein